MMKYTAFALTLLLAAPAFAGTEQPLNPCGLKIKDNQGSSRHGASLDRVCKNSNMMIRCHQLIEKKNIPAAKRQEFMARCARLPSPPARERRAPSP